MPFERLRLGLGLGEEASDSPRLGSARSTGPAAEATLLDKKRLVAREIGMRQDADLAEVAQALVEGAGKYGLLPSGGAARSMREVVDEAHATLTRPR